MTPVIFKTYLILIVSFNFKKSFGVFTSLTIFQGVNVLKKEQRTYFSIKKGQL